MTEMISKPGDVVAVSISGEISFYARIEEIYPDRKKGWYNARFLILAVPLREVTWILEASQIDGEPFTMGGTPLKIERIPFGAGNDETPRAVDREKPKKPAKVIAFPGKDKK